MTIKSIVRIAILYRWYRIYVQDSCNSIFVLSTCSCTVIELQHLMDCGMMVPTAGFFRTLIARRQLRTSTSTTSYSGPAVATGLVGWSPWCELCPRMIDAIILGCVLH